MGEDLMYLITQLQERYQIDQADVDTLVEAINTTVNEEIDAALQGGMEPGEEGLTPAEARMYMREYFGGR